MTPAERITRWAADQADPANEADASALAALAEILEQREELIASAIDMIEATFNARRGELEYEIRRIARAAIRRTEKGEAP